MLLDFDIMTGPSRISNKRQVGDIEIDDRIFPVAAAPVKEPARKNETPALGESLEHWYPQVE